MNYNTFEISQAIKNFFIDNKYTINRSGLCRKIGIRHQPISDLILGTTVCLHQEYINKLLPSLYERGFYYTEMKIDLAFIQTKVCRYFNVPIDKVKSESRKGELVTARQFIFKFGREIAKLTLAKIGAETGDKGHVTVSHGIKTLNNLIETERKTKLHYLALEKRLKQA